ncbi:MAG: exodeoxyribonuclease VII small subunit [Gammaproteobacteria bacterium]|nr:exodeoxyribonuclease VII small subunit [Gammaproteobacteria bacterium]
MSDQEEPDFESTLAALEKVVGDLEGGELPLAAQLAAFEQGMSLADQCKKMLKEAQLRVIQLTGTDEAGNE